MTTSLGYTIFTVPDVKATLTFFNEAFGLTTRMLTPEFDYGELETGQTTLAFVSSELANDNLNDAGGFAELNPSAPPIAASITLVTSDFETDVSRALKHGATSYVEPIQKPWGQLVTYVRDPNGILVEIATPVAA